jgi:cytochrome c biogenesis protein CcdA
MTLLIISFIAGILTVLAPCSLTLLPVIIGGSASGKGKFRPLLVTFGLAISVLIFSLLLRTTTYFISIPDVFWKGLAGGILILFGILSVFPNIWDTISYKLGLANKSNQILDKVSENQEKWYSPILLGASLGPVFSSCSPTFGVLLAVVISQNFATGLLNILVYILGLSLVLIAVGYGGRAVVQKLKWAADPEGNFKKILGLIFITVGLIIVLGLDKSFESWILSNGYFDTFLNFEYDILEQNGI